MLLEVIFCAVCLALPVQDFVTNQPALIPLAGPANRQGRIAADVIMGKEPSRFRGTQVPKCSVVMRPCMGNQHSRANQHGCLPCCQGAAGMA